MIIQVEDQYGETIGTIQLHENNNHEIKIIKYDLSNDLSIADIDYDDIYDTKEQKIRLQLCGEFYIV